MIIHAKKNEAYELAFPMVTTANPETFDTGETVTDTAYYKDGAGAWTSLAITDTVAEIGSTGMYEISLSASEMNHDWIIIKFTSTNAQDTMVTFKTYTRDIDDVAFPTTAGNSIDVTATGAVGIDWGNVENQGATVDLSVTTIDSVDDVTGAVGSVTGSVGSISGVTFPTNFGDLSITVTSGRVDVGSWLGTAVTTSATSNKPEVDVNSISDDATAANNLETMLDGTGGQTLSLGQLNVTASGTNHAIIAAGGVSGGDGIYATGGIGKSGIVAAGGAGQAGFSASGSGTAPGAKFTAGSTGASIEFNTTSGDAIDDSGVSGVAWAGLVDDVWDEAQSGHVGAGTFGEIATEIADILTDTADMQPNYATSAELAKVPKSDGTATWNATALASINAEADTALSDIGLQYLVNTALPTNWSTDITANSALDYMADDGTAVYDRTTDSLQAIADSGGGGPTAAQIADAVWDEATAGHTTAGTFGEQVKTDIDAILVDTADIQPNYATAAELAKVPKSDGTATWNATALASINAEADTALSDIGLQYLVNTALPTSWAADITANSALDYMADDGTAVYDRTTDSLQAISDSGGGGPTAAQIADAVWDEAQADHVTGTSFGAIATEIADILVDTNELQTDDVPGLIAALNDISTAQVNTEVDTALSDIGLDHLLSAAVIGTDVTDNSVIAKLTSKSATADWDSYDNTTDSLEAIRDRGDASWVTGAGGTPPQLLQSTTIATLASQTSFTLTAGSADDDAYNNAIAVITDSATSTQKAVGTVSDYTGATKTVTLSADPGIFTMAVGDTIEIIAALGSAGSAPTAGQVADAVWDEAQADHITVGTFGIIASEIATIDTVVDGIQTDLDNGTDGLGALKTLIDNIDAYFDGNGRVDVGEWLGNVVTHGTGGPDINVNAVNDNLTSAINLAASAAGITVSAVNDGAATSTSFVTDLSEATDDHYNGMILVFTSGALLGQASRISDYAGGSKTVTVAELTEAPADNDTFVIF